MLFGATTLSIRTQHKRLTCDSISDAQHNNALPLCWVSRFIYCYVVILSVVAPCCFFTGEKKSFTTSTTEWTFAFNTLWPLYKDLQIVEPQKGRLNQSTKISVRWRWKASVLWQIAPLHSGAEVGEPAPQILILHYFVLLFHDFLGPML